MSCSCTTAEARVGCQYGCWLLKGEQKAGSQEELRMLVSRNANTFGVKTSKIR